jgi:hypothetical protein
MTGPLPWRKLSEYRIREVYAALISIKLHLESHFEEVNATKKPLSRFRDFFREFRDLK